MTKPRPCANCGQDRYSHPVSPELGCAEYVPTPEVDTLVTPEKMAGWCISCCDGALMDYQRAELFSRIKTCIAMASGEVSGEPDLPY